MSDKTNQEYYKVIIPMRPIKQGVGELKSLQASWVAWEAAREHWRITPKTEQEGGFQKVQEHQRQLEAIDAEQAARIAEVQAKLDALRAEAVAQIDAQVLPNGADVLGDNAADFALIEHNLIDRPEHLRRIVEAHGNTAFRNAAEMYAAARGWEGFEYKAKEESVREYCAQMFDMFGRAAAMPQGPSMMQALTETEPVRIAVACGIADCLPE